VRYDRRGYGRSPAATTWYYETDDLFTLLRHLKISRAFLVGSSHGGALTIDFTLAHPNSSTEWSSSARSSAVTASPIISSIAAMLIMRRWKRTTSRP